MERVALIEELLAPMRKALERAYDQGVANTTADFAEKRRIVLETFGGVAVEAQAPPATRRLRRVVRGPVAARAPKGAVGMVIDLVLRDGMTTREVQDVARDLDASVNPKSIYNELNRREELYRREGGRWFRANQNAEPPTTPASPAKMNGIAGDHGTGPSSGAGLTARGLGAPGEVGGT